MLMKMSEGINSFVQFLTVLFIFLFVLGITFVTTKYIAAIQKNKIGTGNMELIETLRISNSKYLQIVRIGSKYLCMAVCKDTVTMLVELEEEEIKTSETAGTAMDFQGIFEKMKDRAGFYKKETNEDNRR